MIVASSALPVIIGSGRLFWLFLLHLFLLALTFAPERTHFLQLSVDLLLNGDGDSREKRRVPVQFGQELTHHLADANHVATAGFDVDLFLVVQVRLEPKGKGSCTCRCWKFSFLKQRR